MSQVPSSIIPCPACKVKNRIKKFESGKIPLCAKCGARLVSEKENETQAWYSKSLKDLSDIPEPGIHGES
ncbi:MAG: hypothetical protein QGI90_08395 [Nitrospinaceae bacterium]|jgi:transcription initiation factor TFIIIB Brf1 subunit/transcription initiation factor TFIIB|nr:hypothetical protein [Nitrospinaceae bacterium]MDP7148696.1 hypothetical protein [Nitrospinaceae bacterium]|tara:strand:+ start:555 stop:764 length:210 start_codon:yes stop_codon:yes gene_type:complete